MKCTKHSQCSSGYCGVSGTCETPLFGEPCKRNPDTCSINCMCHKENMRCTFRNSIVNDPCIYHKDCLKLGTYCHDGKCLSQAELGEECFDWLDGCKDGLICDSSKNVCVERCNDDLDCPNEMECGFMMCKKKILFDDPDPEPKIDPPPAPNPPPPIPIPSREHHHESSSSNYSFWRSFPAWVNVLFVIAVLGIVILVIMTIWKCCKRSKARKENNVFVDLGPPQSYPPPPQFHPSSPVGYHYPTVISPQPNYPSQSSYPSQPNYPPPVYHDQSPIHSFSPIPSPSPHEKH